MPHTLQVLKTITEAAKWQEWAVTMQSAGISQMRDIFLHVQINNIASAHYIVEDMIYLSVAIIMLA